MARIGIFGGSFNPIHNGHMGIARQALVDWDLARLYVVPARVSPFKAETPPGEVLAGFTDAERWAMVCAACRDEPRLVPWAIELDRGGVSFAIDTVRAAQARHPGDELFFVIGADSVPGLPRWKAWDELRSLCRFVSYPRTPESSTEIRRRLAAGCPVDDLVPPAVAALFKNARR